MHLVKKVFKLLCMKDHYLYKKIIFSVYMIKIIINIFAIPLSINQDRKVLKCIA